MCEVLKREPPLQSFESEERKGYFFNFCQKMNSSLDVKSVENNLRTNCILSRSEHEAFLPCSKIRPQLWWQEQRASWACLPLLPSLLLTPPPPLFCNALAHPANWTQSCKMSRISRIYPSEKVNRSGKCKNSFHLVY